MAENDTQTPEETLEVLEPQATVYEWTLGVGNEAVTFTQRPLSYFGKLEFISKLAQALDLAMREISLDDIFAGTSIRTPDGRINMQATSEATQFLKVIAKVMTYAPDLLKDMYCIWLAIPRTDREWAKFCMEQPKDLGGFDDEDGFKIIDVFIDQNGEVLAGFFEDRIKPLASKARASYEASQSSRHSKDTQQNTRKRSKSS